MEKLIEALKEYLDKQPNLGQIDDLDFSDAKGFHFINEALDKAGYRLEAHQQGIWGTMLVVVPKETK